MQLTTIILLTCPIIIIQNVHVLFTPQIYAEIGTSCFSVKRQSLKVQINATGDAVCMKYIRPSPSIRLEGFILGYGSSFFSNQYIPLPSDGKPYITEVGKAICKTLFWTHGCGFVFWIHGCGCGIWEHLFVVLGRHGGLRAKETGNHQLQILLCALNDILFYSLASTFPVARIISCVYKTW